MRDDGDSVENEEVADDREPMLFPPPSLSLRRLAFETALQSTGESGQRLSGNETLKLARRYLKFLEGGDE